VLVLHHLTVAELLFFAVSLQPENVSSLELVTFFMATFMPNDPLAHQEQTQHPFDLPNTAWYHKSLPTFADALALVRQQLWQVRLFHLSTGETDTVNVPRALFNCWSSLLCYAA